MPIPTRLDPHQLRLRLLASPINPSDLNQIEGVYPIRPAVPNALAGNEGVAEVIEVGSALRDRWRVGERVLPSQACFGTLRISSLLVLFWFIFGITLHRMLASGSSSDGTGSHENPT